MGLQKSSKYSIRLLVERIATAILLIGGIGILGSMFLGTADVIGTKFFNWPLPGALELTESTMVLIVFGGLATAQIRRGHIRVELVYVHMGPRLKALMDIIASFSAICFFSLLIWQASGEAIKSWHIREATVGLIRFPLYPARWVLVLGTAIMIVQLVLDLIQYTSFIIKKDIYERPDRN